MFYEEKYIKKLLNKIQIVKKRRKLKLEIIVVYIFQQIIYINIIYINLCM